MPHSLSPSLLSVFPINHDCITGRRRKCGMNQREKWQRSSSGVSAPVYQSSTTSMSQNIKHKTVLFKKAQSQITINNNRETEKKQHQWSQCSVWVLFCLLRFSLAVVDRTYSTHMQASRPANMWYQLKDKQTNKKNVKRHSWTNTNSKTKINLNVIPVTQKSSLQKWLNKHKHNQQPQRQRHENTQAHTHAHTHTDTVLCVRGDWILPPSSLPTEIKHCASVYVLTDVHACANPTVLTYGLLRYDARRDQQLCEKNEAKGYF